VLDVLEPVRTVADRVVLHLVSAQVFSPGDHKLTARGAVYLHPPLARRVASVAGKIASQVANLDYKALFRLQLNADNDVINSFNTSDDRRCHQLVIPVPGYTQTASIGGVQQNHSQRGTPPSSSLSSSSSPRGRDGAPLSARQAIMPVAPIVKIRYHECTNIKRRLRNLEARERSLKIEMVESDRILPRRR
jgi:hypothetical protein